ncbi:MAG TPA: rod shape-determining protein MreD [Deltaproteobacteria bacterium]|nr:rod shape-determining protein MreD [Deltaproteobacteria bacterium]
MKTFVVYLIIGIIFQILNTTLLQAILPYNFLPDFMLVLVFYLGFHRRSVEGVITSFSLGFITDTFSGGVMGITSFGLVSVFVLTYALSRKMTADALPVKIGGTFIMALLKAGLIYIVLRAILFGRDTQFYTLAIPSALSTALLSPFVFSLLDRVERSLTQRQQSDPIL